MSRVGIQPIKIPDGVEVSLGDSQVTVKGQSGEVTRKVHPKMKVEIKDGEVIVSRRADDKDSRSLHGMTRSMIDSMIEGVQKNFEKRLEMEGVGYRAQKQGQKLVLEVGYSHPVEVEPRTGIEIEVEDGQIIVRGADKQLVGEIAAEIRAVREPEPYKGKGIRYVGEYIRRKEGKTG